MTIGPKLQAVTTNVNFFACSSSYLNKTKMSINVTCTLHFTAFCSNMYMIRTLSEIDMLIIYNDPKRQNSLVTLSTIVIKNK